MSNLMRFCSRVAMLAALGLLFASSEASAQRTCNTDQECRQSPTDFDKCLLGTCTDSACDFDSNCDARERCTRQTHGTYLCEQVECRVDGDCPPRGDLTAGDARRFCLSYVCEQCKFDNQCRSRSCNEQTNDCITCRADGDCPSGFPRCFHGTCGNCSSDADCSKPGYCGESNACVTGACRTSADCLQGWDCLSGRCAVQKTDLQRVLSELSKLRRLTVEVPPEAGRPVTFDLGELGSLINGSGAVRGTIGLVILDKSGRRLLDLGRFNATSTGGVGLPRSFSGTPASTIQRSGDLCGYGVGVTDERGNLQGQTSVCLEVK